MTTTDALIDRIKTHRVFDHPLYEHWAAAPPSAEVSGALFHQVQSFCASTRPGGEFPPPCAPSAGTSRRSSSRRSSTVSPDTAPNSRRWRVTS